MAVVVGHRRRNAVAIVACIAATTIAGCSWTRDPDAPSAKAAPDYGQQATLRAIGGSAVFGKIRVIDRGSGATVLVSVLNIPPGAFRIAIHETPNCSSPNGFSAGPAWAPAGMRPQDLIRTLYVDSEGRSETEVRVAGLRASNVAGHSVVIYAGSAITDARPSVPNDRIACGVFQPAVPPTFF